VEGVKEGFAREGGRFAREGAVEELQKQNLNCAGPALEWGDNAAWRGNLLDSHGLWGKRREGATCAACGSTQCRD